MYVCHALGCALQSVLQSSAVLLNGMFPGENCKFLTGTMKTRKWVMTGVVGVVSAHRMLQFVEFSTAAITSRFFIPQSWKWV